MGYAASDDPHKLRAFVNGLKGTENRSITSARNMPNVAKFVYDAATNQGIMGEMGPEEGVQPSHYQLLTKMGLTDPKDTFFGQVDDKGRGEFLVAESSMGRCTGVIHHLRRGSPEARCQLHRSATRRRGLDVLGPMPIRNWQPPMPMAAMQIVELCA
jgi:hypothetical protein